MSASLLAIALNMAVAPEPAECTDVVEGRVVDETTARPVVGAKVRLGDSVVETDDTGHFELPGICPGDHALTVERLEYETVEYDVTVDGDIVVDVHALPREIEHDDHVLVRVSETPKTETRASTTLEGEALARTRGKTFADSLASVSGVTVLRSTAGGMGKPIIRGQYGRRNLLLTDGVRHEGQRWGLDHAPEIDPFSAGSIVVRKGSGSMRYGPDAVGGVVLVEPPPLPRAAGVTGQAHLVGVSNGLGGVTAMRLDGAHRRLPGFAWRVEGNASRMAALGAPDYPLDNTGSLSWNAGSTLGYVGGGWDLKLSYRRHFTKAGICTCLRVSSAEDFERGLEQGRPVGVDDYSAEARIERAFQQVAHDLALARTHVSLGRAGELTATYAFQDDHREEFDRARDSVQGPQLEFDLRTHAGDVAFEHSPVALSEGLWLEGTAGGVVSQQSNGFAGSHYVTTDYQRWAGGVFVLERVVSDLFEMQWGARYDGQGGMAGRSENNEPRRCEEDESSGEGRCDLSFQAVSGSYGVLVRPLEDAELRLDLTSAARMPYVDELYSNGRAPSFPALVKGDPTLEVERTWGSSLTLETSSRWLATETSVYVNYIDDYIYLEPRGFTTTVTGPVPEFRYRPVDAVFHGGEHAFAAAPPRWPVSFDGQLSVVRALDVQTPGYLTFVPPGRYRLGVTYRWPEISRLRNGYVSVHGTYFDRQRRYDRQADLAPPPDAYFLLGASAGLQLPLGDQLLSIGLEGTNLTGSRYRRYISLLRYFADEPGWGLRLRLSLDFAIERPGHHEHGGHDHRHG